MTDGNKSTLEQWERYLTPAQTPAYGTYQDRVQEYRLVTNTLLEMGLENGDLIVDIGAGSCDMDQWLRTGAGWQGRYVPIDGATTGTDLGRWIPTIPADWFVCIETLEHIAQWDVLLCAMLPLARKGVVVTTPNAATVDVLSTDPTHCSPIFAYQLEQLGMTVSFADMNPSQGILSTLLGVFKAS